MYCKNYGPPHLLKFLASPLACIIFCASIQIIIHTIMLLIFALLTVFLFSVMLIANNNDEKKFRTKKINEISQIVPIFMYLMAKLFT